MKFQFLILRTFSLNNKQKRLSMSDETFSSLFENSAKKRVLPLRTLRLGEKLEVTITAIGQDSVFANADGKQDGVFAKIDLVNAEGKVFVEVGSRVLALVKSIDISSGLVQFSPLVIRTQPGEDGLQGLQKEGLASANVIVVGTHVKAKVVRLEQYGAFLQINGTAGRTGRGLLPLSESKLPRGSDIKKHFSIGQEVEVKIIEFEPTNEKIKFSIRALENDAESKTYQNYEKDQTAKSKTKGFGTFADLMKKK